MKLVNDGIILNIWADDNLKCGKSFQWVCSALEGSSTGASDKVQTQLLKLMSAVQQETTGLQGECREIRGLLQELQILLQDLANCNANNREPIKNFRCCFTLSPPCMPSHKMRFRI